MQLIPKIIALTGADGIISADLTVLIAGIIRNYSAYTLEEIYLAFELNMTDEGNKIQHFNRFNFDYFTNVITAYRKKKQTAWIEYVKLKNDKLAIDPPKKATDEEIGKGVIKHYQVHGEMPQFANWWATFTYLWSSGQTHDKEYLAAYFASKSDLIKARISNELIQASTSTQRDVIKTKLLPNAIKSEVREMYCRERIPELVTVETE